MAGHDHAKESEPGAIANRAADRLAFALEEVGFDVGREFPALRGDVDQNAIAGVHLGRVAGTVAFRLAEVLLSAAEHGITR